jgi:hypothetical protein
MDRTPHNHNGENLQILYVIIVQCVDPLLVNDCATSNRTEIITTQETSKLQETEGIFGGSV